MMPEYINIADSVLMILEIVGGSAILGALFPNASALKVSKALVVLRKVIDFLGFNFGNAANKE